MSIRNNDIWLLTDGDDTLVEAFYDTEVECIFQVFF